MTNRTATYAALLALTQCVSGPAAAQTLPYQTINIKGSASTFVTGINHSGNMAVNHTDAAGTTHGVTINASLITKEQPATQSIMRAKLLADIRRLVRSTGFFYFNGAYTDIVVPTANGYTVACGMNNIGDIVGTFNDTVGHVTAKPIHDRHHV